MPLIAVVPFLRETFQLSEIVFSSLKLTLTVGFGQRPAARLGRLSGLLLSSLLLFPLARQHLRAEIRERCLGAVEAFPAPYGGEEIGLAPFRIARRW